MNTDYKAPIVLSLWLSSPVPGSRGCHQGRHRQHLCHTAPRQLQREARTPASPFHSSSASSAVQEGHRGLVGNWCHSQRNLLHLEERQDMASADKSAVSRNGPRRKEGFSHDKGILDTGTVSLQLTTEQRRRGDSVFAGQSRAELLLKPPARRLSLVWPIWSFPQKIKNTWHVNLAFIFQMCSS